MYSLDSPQSYILIIYNARKEKKILFSYFSAIIWRFFSANGTVDLSGFCASIVLISPRNSCFYRKDDVLFYPITKFHREKLLRNAKKNPFFSPFHEKDFFL